MPVRSAAPAVKSNTVEFGCTCSSMCSRPVAIILSNTPVPKYANLFEEVDELLTRMPRRRGATKTLMLPKPLSFCESHRQNPDMVTEMDRLLDDYNYADTARILNVKEFKTGDGLPLTPPAVGYIRKAYGLKSRFDRLREHGLLTIAEMAKACGVSINTIGHWRRKGLIRAHTVNNRMQFLFEHPGTNPPKKHGRKVSRKAA